MSGSCLNPESSLEIKPIPVLDGVDGCGIVPPDPGEIAVALERALSPPRRVDARGRMQRYSLESTARSVIGVYEDVLGRPQGGGS